MKMHVNLRYYLAEFFSEGEMFQKKEHENQTYIHFTLYNIFFLNFALYEIMWKNMVEPEKPQKKIKYNT